jgi:tetratricopeptide (TPR) repeat protein
MNAIARLIRRRTVGWDKVPPEAGTRPLQLSALPVWFALIALAPALFTGCSTFRKQKVVPDSVATCRQLSCEGVAAMERGHLDEAHELLDKAVKTSPGDLDARRQLAEVLWRSGSPQEAVAHMQAAVNLDSRHAPTVVRSGEMLLGVGAVDRARSRAEEAIALDPQLASAWALRGRVYRHQGDMERALADMQHALRFSPHSVDMLQDTAEIQYQLGRPQRALTTVQHLLTSTPPEGRPREALWLAGLAYGAVNRWDDALVSLNAASQLGEPHPELLYQLARAQQATGRSQEASATVRQALAVDGAHQGSRELLASLDAAGAPGVDAPILR